MQRSCAGLLSETASLIVLARLFGAWEQEEIEIEKILAEGQTLLGGRPSRRRVTPPSVAWLGGSLWITEGKLDRYRYRLSLLSVDDSAVGTDCRQRPEVALDADAGESSSI